MTVILSDNTHRKDYWNGSTDRITTWLLIEDNGSEDGGEIIAEFREREYAKDFCQAKDWAFIE